MFNIKRNAKGENSLPRAVQEQHLCFYAVQYLYC